MKTSPPPKRKFIKSYHIAIRANKDGTYCVYECNFCNDINHDDTKL